MTLLKTTLRQSARVALGKAYRSIPLASLAVLTRSKMRTVFLGRSLLGGAVIGGGLAVEMGSQLARTILLARVLDAAEFGVVASIMTLAAIVDMISYVGLERFIVYSLAGSGPAALKTAHALQWSRALFSSMLIVAVAYPTAALLGVANLWGSFALVALMPLLRGSAHLGVVQMQRSRRFLPSAVTESGGALLGLITAGVGTTLFPNHLDIVLALAAQSLGSVALSHFYARKVPYQIGYDPSCAREALRFGLPLVGNGLAMAAVYQIDRIVVGVRLGVTAVGLYGLTMTLLLQPLSLLMRLITTALQPRMSVAWHNEGPQPSAEGTLAHLVRGLGYVTASLGGIGAAGAVCLGAPVLQMIFGPAYNVSDLFFALIAAVILLRLCRAAQGVLGLSIGRTADLMVSNIGGAVALPCMVAAIAVHAALESAMFGICFGEAVSVCIAQHRLSRHCGRVAPALTEGVVASAAVPAALGVWVFLTDPALTARAAAAVIGMFAAPLIVLLLSRLRSRARERDISTASD